MQPGQALDDSASEQTPAAQLEEALEVASAVGRIRRSAVPQALLVKPRVGHLLTLALCDWGLIALCWLGMAWAPAELYPLWALIVGGRLHGFGVLLHDLSHLPLRRKGWRDRALEVLCGYPIATTLEAMRYHHLRHHRDTCMASDPYYAGGPINNKRYLRKGPVVFVGMWCRFSLFIPFWTVRGFVGAGAFVFPSWRNVYAKVFLQDTDSRDLRCSRELIGTAREEWGQVLFQAICIGAIATLNVELLLYYYLIPLLIASLLCGYRVLREHNYREVASRRPETIMTITRDHNARPPLSWLFGPRNIGFHLVHHLHPQVALEHLPALRLWYRQRYPDLYPDFGCTMPLTKLSDPLS